MAIKRVQSPFAAGERAIRRIEKQEEAARASIQKKESRAFDERMRQAKADRERKTEIRRKAGLEAEDRRMRQDLIKSLAKGEGVGMFGAKLPRINKFIIHAGEESKDPATGKIVRKNVMDFDAEIDSGHIDKLRTLASLHRDGEAARALALQRTGTLPPKQEKALSDLGSDDFPGFSRQEHLQQAMAAPIFEGDPEAEVGPITSGGMPVGETPTPQPQMHPLAPGDIDLTQLLSQGIIGPPQGTTPDTFQPGFEQGFQGVDEPAAPIENIHEVIQSGLVPGTKAQTKQQRSPTQEKIDAFVATMHAMGQEVQPEMIQRMVGAAEKGPDLLKQTMIDFFRESSGLPPIGTGTAEAGTTPTAAPKKEAAKKRGAAAPEITDQFIDEAKRQFLKKNPDRTIEKTIIRGNSVIFIDDEGFENVASPKARS